jgi:tetratricopeptide (TPR) repeat protein
VTGGGPTPGLHQRAKDLFLAALERPAGQRTAFLDQACEGNAALRDEAASLLAFHEEAEAHHPAAEPAFAPGDVFAGRYRMIARIGRGGMGDVWRAQDLILKTPVALKLIYSTAAEDRERILNEVRVARQITHPSVCRVFDVGESDDGIFYSMELVAGEDLAAFLRRVGRLPPEKVLDIARQLCGGLEAAHARGVLHRDLKPANVLIDNDGQVRITDFGIAVPRGEAGRNTLIGTPAYMAPEQRIPGAELSERTDIYALGLVLYELLVGPDALQRANDGTPHPVKPSTIVPDVEPTLARIVMRALNPDPAGRPGSAAEMLALLSPTGTGRGFLPRAGSDAAVRWWFGATMALATLGLVIAYAFVGSPSTTLTAQDTIVVADFENTTGEPVFDGALKVALAVALEQSPFLKVFPDERARETLRLMQRPPDAPITRAIAREIAQRERIKALLAGSISRLGRNYVLALEAVNAQNGDVMAREQAEAASREEVLETLGTVATRLRETLGESLSSVQRFDMPLARATTPSLDALNAYSLALSNGREVPRLEAIPQLERAIELDPDFAMAHALLSEIYVNTGQSALAPPFAKKAFDLKDRVSQHERFFIEWRYYRDAVQAWDSALERARLWSETYPREPFAHNSLGVALLRLGEFDRAVEPFRRAITLDPGFSPPYANLAATYLALSRLDEAKATLQDAAKRQLDFAGARRLSFLVAFVEGDTATMERQLKLSLGPRATNAAFGWEAHTLAFRGRVRQAHEQFRRGIQSALQGNFDEVAAHLTMEDAETHAIVGQCADARREVPPGLGLSRDNVTLERASRVLALCGQPGDAGVLVRELERRFPEATLTARVALPVTAAAIAVAEADPARAIQRLDPVRQYNRAPSGEFWPSYLRGLAYLQLSDAAAAAAEFRSILDRRGEAPDSLLYPLAHLGLARATTAMGLADAGTYYERLLRLWADADQDLAPLREAQTELKRLRH